jgi:pyruvate/2-oxoglutarate dehydrogenase complex dihydrolipoamide acyltransferase (E2) component
MAEAENVIAAAKDADEAAAATATAAATSPAAAVASSSSLSLLSRPLPSLSATARKRNRDIRESAKMVLESIPQIPIHVTEIKKLILKDGAGKSNGILYDPDRYSRAQGERSA